MGLIVANIGQALGVIPDAMVSTVVIMSVLTTPVVPPVLTVLYGGRSPAAAAAGDTIDTTKEFAVADGRLPDL